jgi:serine/threonine-protein kinase
MAGEGSRAFLGLAISADNRAVPVVIIWVPESAEQDPTLLEKMRRETEHAAKLDHPNIVTVLGFAELDEGHARVVEFADGESLRQVLEMGKPLPAPIAARIICDASTGAHYAHVAGNDDGTPLVHGDLRPETLLVGFNGVTKVTGYGALAFAPREMAGRRAQVRQVYLAPEQIISGRTSIGLSTDVYWG